MSSCTGPRQPPAIDDEVLLADGALLEPALQDLTYAGRIASLRRQRRPGYVWSHAVVGHRPPGVILRSRLREPDVACIAGELSALERPDDGVAVADLPPRSAHEVRPALHLCR